MAQALVEQRARIHKTARLTAGVTTIRSTRSGVKAQTRLEHVPSPPNRRAKGRQSTQTNCSSLQRPRGQTSLLKKDSDAHYRRGVNSKLCVAARSPTRLSQHPSTQRLRAQAQPPERKPEKNCRSKCLAQRRLCRHRYLKCHSRVQLEI